MNRDAVCVLLPAYEERETVGAVVRGFQSAGFENVLVMDGGSSDGTRAAAREAGARVEVQSGTGKGQAVREAVAEYVDARYVLLADADQTYQPDDADRMVAPLFADEADHVIGNRYADMEDGAMTRFNDLGNWIFNGLFRLIHGRDYVDILSGYRAFTRSSFERLRLRADGFGIETEIAVECARRDQRVTVVPITYLARPDGSSTNLHPVKDGWIILSALYRRAKTSNPLFYFGSAGLALGAIGSGIELFVAYDWFVNRVSHEVLAVAGGILLVLAVQFAVFGALSDLVVTLHEESLDRIEAVERRVDSESPRLRSDATTDRKTRDTTDTTPPTDRQHSDTTDTTPPTDRQHSDTTDTTPPTDGRRSKTTDTTPPSDERDSTDRSETRGGTDGPTTDGGADSDGEQQPETREE